MLELELVPSTAGVVGHCTGCTGDKSPGVGWCLSQPTFLSFQLWIHWRASATFSGTASACVPGGGGGEGGGEGR